MPPSGRWSRRRAIRPRRPGGDAAQQRLAEAAATLRRFQEAIAAGVDPAAVVDPINRARAERDAARACLAHPEQQPELYSEAQVRAMVDTLGDVGAVIGRASPDRLAGLYHELDIGVRYEPSEFGGSATVTMRVANECVRGGLGHEFVATLRQAGVHVPDGTHRMLAGPGQSFRRDFVAVLQFKATSW